MKRTDARLRGGLSSTEGTIRGCVCKVEGSFTRSMSANALSSRVTRNGCRTGENDDMHFRAAALSMAVLLAVTFIGQAQDNTLPDHRCFVSARGMADPAAPTFEQYAAERSAPFSPVPLDLQSNPIARRHSTLIREQMTHGPNYADHYRVVSWGCGTSCSQFAVVNLKTGHVIILKGMYSVAHDINLRTDGFLPDTDSKSNGFRFKKDSKLLVLVGAVVADHSKKVRFKEGASYYVLKGENLQFVHRTNFTDFTCPP